MVIYYIVFQQKPILNLKDTIITSNDYKTLKSNKLNNIKKEIIIQKNMIIFIIFEYSNISIY